MRVGGQPSPLPSHMHTNSVLIVAELASWSAGGAEIANQVSALAVI